MSPSALDAIRRYVFGFVNSHDFSVCRELMSDDYRCTWATARWSAVTPTTYPLSNIRSTSFPTWA